MKTLNYLLAYLTIKFLLFINKILDFTQDKIIDLCVYLSDDCVLDEVEGKDETRDNK